MLSLIEPTFKSDLMISPVEPIYKTRIRKQPYQNIYLPNRKPKGTFKEVLDKEISTGLGSKISFVPTQQSDSTASPAFVVNLSTEGVHADRDHHHEGRHDGNGSNYDTGLNQQIG